VEERALDKKQKRDEMGERWEREERHGKCWESRNNREVR